MCILIPPRAEHYGEIPPHEWPELIRIENAYHADRSTKAARAAHADVLIARYQPDADDLNVYFEPEFGYPKTSIVRANFRKYLPHTEDDLRNWGQS